MQFLIKIDFLKYNQRIVTLMLIENIVKYSTYLIGGDPTFVQRIPELFFNSKTILSNEPQIATRSCYQLLRMCEKANLVSVAP
jgi:hypothetical protein